MSLLSSTAPPTYSYSTSVYPFFCRPICPSGNKRYNRPPSPSDPKTALPNIPANTKIRSYSDGLLDGELPCGWSERLHPEGDPYFYHTDKRLLANLDPRNPQIRKCLYQAYDDIVFRLETRDDVEIYIDLEFPPNQPPSVIASYYLVDHKSRQIFWTYDVDFNVVGMPQCQSKGQLKSYLTSEYWVHVDYFPLPDYFALYFNEPEAELIGILIHCAVDDKTAPGSTSPWGASECQQYATMLKELRSLDQKTSYRVASVARLYSALCRARHINSWGQTNARLDRLQAYVDFTPLRPSFLMSACEVASFGVSVGILRRMSTLFNGRVVFHRHWDVFFDDIRSTWLQTSGINGLILLCDIALIVSKLNNVATAASASLSGASIFIGIFLHQKHPQWKLATGPDISQYIMSVEDYYQGLRPLSIILALPQTISIYSALSFHIGLLLVVTDRIAQVQEAMWTLIAMTIGLIPLAASLRFFAAPKPESQASGGIKSIWKKLKGAPLQERNV